MSVSEMTRKPIPDEDVMEHTLVAGRAQAKQLGLPRLHEPDRAPVAAHTHEARIVVCVRAEGPHGWLFYGHPHVVLARKVNQRVGDPKGVDVGKRRFFPTVMWRSMCVARAAIICLYA